jgi:hypothetical protein
MEKLCPYRKQVTYVSETRAVKPGQELSHTEESFLPCVGEACMLYRTWYEKEYCAIAWKP